MIHFLPFNPNFTLVIVKLIIRLQLAISNCKVPFFKQEVLAVHPYLRMP